jgi:hypothetical protein
MYQEERSALGFIPTRGTLHSGLSYPSPTTILSIGFGYLFGPEVCLRLLSLSSSQGARIAEEPLCGTASLPKVGRPVVPVSTRSPPPCRGLLLWIQLLIEPVLRAAIAGIRNSAATGYYVLTDALCAADAHIVAVAFLLGNHACVAAISGSIDRSLIKHSRLL